MLRKPDSTYYYIPKEYTIASANTWQKVTLTYGPDDTNGSVIKASSVKYDKPTWEIQAQL